MAGVEGRIALITGGSRGIGRVTAELLASRGARVMCVARSEQELAEVALEYSVADLGTPDGCARAVAETERRLGPIEILVCNHGIGSAHERVIWEQDSDIWRETMRINLDGPFHLSKLVLRGMTERGYGRVVYTSSTAGLVAEHAGSAYNSSKHGLLGLMRSVAQDGGSYGVTSNAVLPGWVRTEMAERSGPPGSRGSWYHDRSGVGGTRGTVSCQPRCHDPGSSRGHRVSRIRGIQRR